MRCKRPHRRRSFSQFSQQRSGCSQSRRAIVRWPLCGARPSGPGASIVVNHAQTRSLSGTCSRSFVAQPVSIPTVGLNDPASAQCRRGAPIAMPPGRNIWCGRLRKRRRALRRCGRKRPNSRTARSRCSASTTRTRSRRCAIAWASETSSPASSAPCHLGYAQPVGGVIAYEKQISISGVGFDIGCGNMAVRLDTKFRLDRSPGRRHRQGHAQDDLVWHRPEQ